MRKAALWSVLLTIALAMVVGVLAMLPPSLYDKLDGSDALYHFTAFTALAVPVAAVRPRWSPVLFVLLAAYGAAIEIIQPSFDRSMELEDLFFDAAGIGFGIVLGLMIRRIFRTRSAQNMRDDRTENHRSGSDY